MISIAIIRLKLATMPVTAAAAGPGDFSIWRAASRATGERGCGSAASRRAQTMGASAITPNSRQPMAA